MITLTHHSVKSWPEFFTAILNGSRTHELRRNDRNYKVGDYIDLREFDPTTQLYTGRQLTVEITSMTSQGNPCAVSAEGLSPNFCILSIRLMGT